MIKLRLDSRLSTQTFTYLLLPLSLFLFKASLKVESLGLTPPVGPPRQPLRPPSGENADNEEEDDDDDADDDDEEDYPDSTIAGRPLPPSPPSSIRPLP